MRFVVRGVNGSLRVAVVILMSGLFVTVTPKASGQETETETRRVTLVFRGEEVGRFEFPSTALQILQPEEVPVTGGAEEEAAEPGAGNEEAAETMLVLPNGAIFDRAGRDAVFLFITKEDAPDQFVTPHEIRVKKRGEQMAVIASGLYADQRVVGRPAAVKLEVALNEHIEKEQDLSQNEQLQEEVKTIWTEFFLYGGVVSFFAALAWMWWSSRARAQRLARQRPAETAEEEKKTESAEARD